MRKQVHRLVLPLLFLSITFTALSQDSLVQSNPTQVSSRYLQEVSSKSKSLEQRLDKHSQKALARMQKLERKMQRKLMKLDSAAAKNVFADADSKYQQLEQRIKSGTAGQYIAPLDTMLTSLKFLNQNPQLLAQVKGAKEKLSDALDNASALKEKFRQSEEIKKFLKARKEYLKNNLGNLGFTKELKRISKTHFYYTQQLAEVKQTLKDHRKAEKKAIELLSRTRLFKDFMRRESELASLFRLPGDPNAPVNAANLAGLQTRASVNSLIQQQLSAGGASARQQFSANLQQAQSRLNELKNKITKAGGSNSDAELPEGFTKNGQRGKQFLEKWELGINVQNNRSNRITPVSSDVGISAGFKPNNWFIAGVGVAGRIGWGRDIRHIAVSYSGVSARSFAEVKLKAKGNFHAMIGFEMNYRLEIRSFEQL
jgi:hypothetical protein